MPTLKAPVTPVTVHQEKAKRAGRWSTSRPCSVVRSWLHLLWQALGITGGQPKQLYTKCQQEIPSDQIKQCSSAAFRAGAQSTPQQWDTHPVTFLHHVQTITCRCSLTQSVEVLQRQNGHTVVIKQIREQTYLRLSFIFSSENPLIN